MVLVVSLFEFGLGLSQICSNFAENGFRDFPNFSPIIMLFFPLYIHKIIIMQQLSQKPYRSTVPFYLTVIKIKIYCMNIVMCVYVRVHTIVCRAAKYSQCGHATDKCVFYRNQENAIFMHP